ncbi:hypothetical protein LJB42_003409 [Komagataella kurtzmanii]|nr:hypothetical protein LJB42_003409 [Komagataella kurtzmanii]
MPKPINSPLFPVQSLSRDTVIKLPPKPNAESASVKLYLVLAEKNIFVQGFTEEEFANKPASMLRGSLFLRISKPVKIKTISLKFDGKSRTEWPEGIPPKKLDFFEKVEITQHQWLFYSYSQSFPASEDSINGADLYKKPNDSIDHITSLSLDDDSSSIRQSPKGMTDRLKRAASPSGIKRPSSPSPMSRQGSGFLKHLNDSTTDLRAFKSLDESSLQDSHGKFPAGDYIYNFELPIPACLPETINETFGKVTYTLTAAVERLGTFKTNLHAEIPVNIVRTICEESVEENEPIVVNKTWEDELAYEVVIGSKMIPLNTYMPISFRLVPMTKIQLHRLRVFATENMEYYCHNKKVHRMEPTKKYLLMEYKAPNGQTNLLEDANGMIGMKEFEFEVYVPKKIGEHNTLHPDTSYQNIRSNHWLKVCLRVSRSDPQPDNPDKRKHFEISIDSPVQFLSELAVHANTLLPAYTESLMSTASPHVPHNMSISPPLSPEVIAIDSQVGTVLFPGIRYKTVHQHLENNLYKPDASANPDVLSSPQAQPYSPEHSPVFSPVRSAPCPTRPTSTKNPPSFESVMENTSYEAELPPSYDSLVDKDHHHSISRVLEEVDMGVSFKFQGLSPNLPDSIMRAVSPARGSNSAQNSSSASRPVSTSTSRPASRPASRPPSRTNSRSASRVRGGLATPNSHLSTSSLSTLNAALTEERGRRNRRPSLKPSKSNSLIDNNLDSLLFKGNNIPKEDTPEEEIATMPATAPQPPFDDPRRESYTAFLVSVSGFSGKENDSADAVVKDFSMYRPRTGSSSTIGDDKNGSTTSSPINSPSIYQSATTQAADPVSSLPLLHNSSAANVSESTIIPSEPFLKSEDNLHNALSNSLQSFDISTLLNPKEEGFWHSYANEDTPSWSNNLPGTVQSGSNSLYNRKASTGLAPRIHSGFEKASSDDSNSFGSENSDETTKQ